MSDAVILSRIVLVQLDLLHRDAKWVPIARLTYLSRKCRKSSACSYISSFSWMSLLVHPQAFTKILPLSLLIGLHPMSLLSIWSIKFCWISGVNEFNNFTGHAKALTLKLLKQLLFKVCSQSAEFVVSDSKYRWFPVWPLIHPNRNSNLTQNHLTKTIFFLPPLAPFFGNILFDGQTASRKYDPTVCWLIWSVAVILTFFDIQITFFPLLAFAGNILYFAWLTLASCSWRFLIFCCCASITPAKDGSMLTLLNGAPDEYEDPLKDVECVAVS